MDLVLELLRELLEGTASAVLASAAVAVGLSRCQPPLYDLCGDVFLTMLAACCSILRSSEGFGLIVSLAGSAAMVLLVIEYGDERRERKLHVRRKYLKRACDPTVNASNGSST